MGIESTITLGRKEAIQLAINNTAKLLANIHEKTDEELENLLYATRDSIFDNFMITGE